MPSASPTTAARTSTRRTFGVSKAASPPEVAIRPILAIAAAASHGSPEPFDVADSYRSEMGGGRCYAAPAVRTPITLYLLALGVRLLLIGLFPDPAYPDSSYYVDVARNVAGGQGFNVDFIWIFPEVGGTIPANPVLPIPSNAHWMPLASIVQVPFIWLLRPDRLRVGAAVRDPRLDRGAADLGDRPRRRARPRSSRSARAS